MPERVHRHDNARFWKAAGFLTAAMAMAVASSAHAQPAKADVTSAEQRPPNVLFIAIDDLRPAIGAYGDPIAVTPNIDALADRSLIFERAYVHMATCSPSRASLMSSLRPDTTEIYYSNWETKKVEDAVPIEATMNGYFKANGYETVGIGKIYHTTTDSAAGWSRPLLDHWSDASFRQRADALEPEGYLAAVDWEAAKPGRWRSLPWEAADVDDAAYPDGLNTLFAVQELHRLARTEAPFFLAVGLRRPHLPFNAPKRYWDLYDADALPLPALRTPPENAHPYTLGNSGEIRGYAQTPQGKNPFPDDFVRKMTHGYYANVSYADAMVGKLMKALNDLDLGDDTIVVLWGDHGFKLGEYGGFTKHSNFEIDTRVPLMISLPGDDTQRRTEALVETIDIFPTLTSLAGLEAPDDIAGRSFARLLEKPDRDFKDAAFQQFYRGSAEGDLMGYAVRTKDFRYVAWIVKETGAILGRELYDHRTDPGETVNVADEPGMAKIVAKHERLREKEGHGPS